MWFFKKKPAAIVNMELVERIFTQIRETPHLWDQAGWADKTSCGTTHCFGGWACVLEGRTALDDNGYEYAIDEDGCRTGFSTEAAKLLGFNLVLAREVFYDIPPYRSDVATFEQRVRKSINKYGKLTKQQVNNMLD